MALLRDVMTIMINKRNTLALVLLFGTCVVVQHFLFHGMYSPPMDDMAVAFRLRQTLVSKPVSLDRTSQNKSETIRTGQNQSEKLVLIKTETVKSIHKRASDPILAHNATPIPLVNQVSPQDYYKPRSTKVHRHDFRLLKQPSGCNGSRPFLLILVLSVHEHLDRRTVIRKTWGGAALNGTWPHRPQDGKFTVRVYFLFGKHKGGNRTLESALEKEATAHNDIIQEDFVDTYENLPKKSIMGLKWASEHCTSAAYIMKTDDDTFINLGPLVTYIKANKEAPSKVIGVYCPRSVVIRSGRWGVSKQAYPFARYPPYIAGGPGYIMPAHFAHVLFNLSEYIPEVKMEDVYVTGILTKASKTINVGGARGFQDSSRKFTNVCGLVSQSPVLAVTQLHADTIRRFWDFVATHKSC
ncbi:beta-1,3-galactosyltransferase 5-like [Lineus longissimus]|uniref:beta-1,3-galactosyltransferase 5-like n=1 Tax=Lineus longissimus TaxID=88925 RepID=UPI00315D0B52